MNLISFEEISDSEIRVNENGCYSVFDVIRFCGCKSQHEVWKRLCVSFPEVLTKCENFKFPGKGQRETPVANREYLPLRSLSRPYGSPSSFRLNPKGAKIQSTQAF